MNPTLVILAAGIGRRYGGLKQLEAVGPHDATLMDYTVFDALRAGFGRVVFVIRPEMEAAVQASLGVRYASHVKVSYAHQRLEALPAGVTLPPARAKPWGTGQAVLAAADLVNGPFAVANADDFYGAGSIAALAAFLRNESDAGPPAHALVGYSLRNTLTEAGAVARAICRADPDGWLQSIVEVVGIERRGHGGQYRDAAGAEHSLAGDTLVSMNLWGFRPSIFDELRTGFAHFLQTNVDNADAEFFLPAVVQDAIAAGRARVKVLPSTDTWCGVTHAADRPRVMAQIGALIERGVYPEQLWS